MGYSTPKKQLDLKEFLSIKGKPNRRSPSRYFASTFARSTSESPTPENTTDGKDDGKSS